LSLGRQSATPPAVLCSCLPFKLIIPLFTTESAHFHTLFVPFAERNEIFYALKRAFLSCPQENFIEFSG